MCISVCDACTAQITVPEWSTGATPVPLLSRHDGRCFHLAWLNTAALSQRICRPALESEGHHGSGLSPSYQNRPRTTGPYLGQFNGQIGSYSCSLKRLEPWIDDWNLASRSQACPARGQWGRETAASLCGACWATHVVSLSPLDLLHSSAQLRPWRALI